MDNKEYKGSMKVIKGNLLDAAVNGEVSLIMHGCNCFHAMGSGIAGEIAKRFPEIPASDRKTEYGYTGKIATYAYAPVTYESLPLSKSRGWADKEQRRVVELDNPFVCLNLYTQYNPGPDFLPSLFPPAIAHVNAVFAGHTIGIPLLGCGVGGGDWQCVMGVLLDQGKDVHWVVYVL